MEGEEEKEEKEDGGGGFLKSLFQDILPSSLDVCCP